MTKRKVLIADDEEDIRTMLSEFFELMGFDVLTAENGREGIKRFLESKPDIIITDIKMPKMTGVEFILKILEKGYDPRVIFITGWDKELGILKKESNLFNKFACLKKPFEMNYLMEEVEKTLSK